MTDEEKAINYIIDTYYIKDIDEFDRKLLADEIKMNDKRKIKAFIAGLAEGRKEKWHDLRKDPNDLPKEQGEYRVYFYDSELKANRNVNWHFYGKVWGCRLDVIAWCELPKFEE